MFLTPDPQVAYGGEGFINVATVGQCPFGIVVAFRGTLPPSATDPDSWLGWLQNFFAIPASSPSGPNQVPGQVHSGFFNATTSIIQQVHTLVVALDPTGDTPVFVTGHSKGGAMATIGAYLLSQDRGVPNVQPVITIASPRPGDVNFQTGFEAVMSQTRYENDRDLVPVMPPPLDFIGRMTHNPLLTLTPAGQRLSHMLQSAQDWNYVPVGNRLFITSNFTVISNEDPTAQKLNVVAEFVEDLLTENFSCFGAPTRFCLARDITQVFAVPPNRRWPLELPSEVRAKNPGSNLGRLRNAAPTASSDRRWSWRRLR